MGNRQEVARRERVTKGKRKREETERLAKGERNEISFSGKCTILRRAMEQYYLLGEDRKEMVAWWYERTLPEREEAFKARQNKEEELDEWAVHVKELELERHRKRSNNREDGKLFLV